MKTSSKVQLSKHGVEGMAAPGTAPERFVMVGADSDAVPFDRALNVPQRYGSAKVARNNGNPKHRRPRVAAFPHIAPYPIQTMTE
jgi:hypothetical protein